MKRLLLCLAVAAALGTASASQAAGPHGAKVTLRHTSVGTILATGRGFTLYVFTRDSRRHDSCASVSGCTGVWPVLATKGTPVAGRGLRRALLGTITLPGGTRQVTYAGHPLYTYVGDGGPGETGYVGVSQFGGRWYAIGPSGAIVK